jgi:hypothetical protein
MKPLFTVAMVKLLASERRKNSILIYNKINIGA